MLSSNNWFGISHFPQIPLIQYNISSDAQRFFSILLCLILVGIIFSQGRMEIILILSCLIISSILIISDQLRIQPWIYIYSIIFFLVLISRLNLIKLEHSLNTIKLFVASVYFWSGIHKINFSFYNNIIPWLLAPLTKCGPISQPFLIFFLKIIPFLELSFGFGLIFPKSSTLSMLFLIFMHYLIILIFTFFYPSWNIIIIPWNLGMIFILWTLFFKNKEFVFLSILELNFFLRHLFILFLFLPILNFWGYWDGYLSFSLYSGKTPRYKIMLERKAIEELGEIFPREIIRTEKKDLVSFFPLDWALWEMNIQPPPERRIFLNIFFSFCKNGKKIQKTSRLFEIKPNLFFEGGISTIFNCKGDQLFRFKFEKEKDSSLTFQTEVYEQTFP